MTGAVETGLLTVRGVVVVVVDGGVVVVVVVDGEAVVVVVVEASPGVVVVVVVVEVGAVDGGAAAVAPAAAKARNAPAAMAVSPTEGRNGRRGGRCRPRRNPALDSHELAIDRRLTQHLALPQVRR